MVMLTFPGYFNWFSSNALQLLLDGQFNQKFYSLNLPMEVESTHLNFLCMSAICFPNTEVAMS